MDSVEVKPERPKHQQTEKRKHFDVFLREVRLYSQPKQRGLWEEKFGECGQAELIQASEPNETACSPFLNETVNYSDAASDK